MATSPLSSLASPGTLVWIDNPYPEDDGAYRKDWLPAGAAGRPSHVPGTVHSVLPQATAGNELRVVVLTTLSPPMRVEVAAAALHSRREDVLRLTNFVHMLPEQLNAVNVAHTVALRFTHDLIYTDAGPVLLAVNPHCLINDDLGLPIYDPSVMFRYRSRPAMEALARLPRAERELKSLAPHVFSKADDVHQTMLTEGLPQTLLLLGESGSGKTETAKLALQYLINTSQSARAVSTADSSKAALSVVERLVWVANDIVEAFANAATPLNSNSSRVGVSTKLVFNDAGSIIDCELDSLELETRRVVSRATGERNFHVFYQFLASLTPERREAAGVLSAPADYKYLAEAAPGAPPATDGDEDDLDDAQLYAQVKRAMALMGFSDDVVAGIEAVLVAVLSLGNVSFADGESGTVVEDAKPLHTAAESLGVDAALLTSFLSHKVGKDKGVSLPAGEATARRDAFACFLYAALFKWLIARMNATIATAAAAATPHPPASPPSITLLDCYGFEDLAMSFDPAAVPSPAAVRAAPNALSQLLLNYAAEKQLAFVRQTVYANEGGLYDAQGVPAPVVEWWNSAGLVRVLDSLHKPTGVLALLDEACLYHLTPASFAVKLDTLKRHEEYERAAPATHRAGFVIQHSRGPVLYSALEFLEDNRRTGVTALPAELVALCGGSSTPGVADVFHGVSLDDSSGRRPLVAARFQGALEHTLAAAAATHPHFVYCLRPNAEQAQGKVDVTLLAAQLSALRVHETTGVVAAGFPHRLPMSEFYGRYVMLNYAVMARHGAVPPEDLEPVVLREQVADLVDRVWGTLADPPAAGSRPGAGDRLLNGVHHKADQVQLGSTVVLLRDAFVVALENARDHRLSSMDAATVAVQKVYRGHRSSKRYTAGKDAVVRVQAAARGRAARAQQAAVVDSGVSIKRFFLMLRQRERFQLQRESATAIQKAFRLFRQRTSFVRLRITALTVHLLARGFIMRRQIITKAASLRRLQRFARVFLVRNRIFWARVRGALMLQSAWRGFRNRQVHGEVVDHLSAFRRRAAKARFFRLVFATFKGRLVRERFLVMREAAVMIQRLVRTKQSRRWFVAAREAAVPIQAMVRGRQARHVVANIQSLNMAADEAWAVHSLRADEAAAVLKNGVELHSATFWQSVTKVGSKGTSVVPTVRSMARTVDLDVLTDVADVYPEGWSGLVGALEASLLKSGQHTTAVAVGDSHTVLAASNGDVYTFGWGDRGQLGHGNTANVDAPSRVVGFGVPKSAGFGRMASKVPVVALAAGADHTLGLTRDGRVFSWGQNNRGQLGLGHRRPVSTPTHVSTVNRKVSAVACGALHSVLVTVAGSVYTCGAGPSLGFAGVPVPLVGGAPTLGPTPSSSTVSVEDKELPTGLKALSRFSVRAVACGWGHTVVLSHSGDMYSWGSGDTGQLGLGAARSRLVPALITRTPESWAAEEAELQALAAEHAAAVVAAEMAGDAAVAAAALSPDALQHLQSRAQALAEAREFDREVDDRAPPPYRIAAIACGARHTVALSSSGRVYAWGCNTNGQLGVGDRVQRNAPTLVQGELSHAKCTAVSAGWRNSVALTQDHVMYEFGHAGCVSEQAVRADTGQTLDPRDPETYLEFVESLLPRRVYVKGSEGYQAERVVASWSRSMSAVHAWYSTSKNTSAMVEAVMERLADDTEEVLWAEDDDGEEEKASPMRGRPLSPSSSVASRSPSPMPRAAVLQTLHVVPPSANEVDAVIAQKHPEIVPMLAILRGEARPRGLDDEELAAGRTMVETLRDHYRNQLHRRREDAAVTEASARSVARSPAPPAPRQPTEWEAKRSSPASAPKKSWAEMTPKERFKSLNLRRSHLAALTKEQLAKLAFALRAVTHDAARPHLAPTKARDTDRKKPLNEEIKSHRFRSSGASPDAKRAELGWDSSASRSSWRRSPKKSTPRARAQAAADASLAKEAASETQWTLSPTVLDAAVSRRAAETASRTKQLPKFQSQAMELAATAREEELRRRTSTLATAEDLPTSPAGVEAFLTEEALDTPDPTSTAVAPRRTRVRTEEVDARAQLLVGGKYDMAITQRDAIVAARREAALRAEKEARRVAARKERDEWRRAKEKPSLQAGGPPTHRTIHSARASEGGAMGLFSTELLVATRNPEVSVKDLKARRRGTGGTHPQDLDVKLHTFRKTASGVGSSGTSTPTRTLFSSDTKPKPSPVVAPASAPAPAPAAARPKVRRPTAVALTPPPPPQPFGTSSPRARNLGTGDRRLTTAPAPPLPPGHNRAPPGARQVAQTPPTTAPPPPPARLPAMSPLKPQARPTGAALDVSAAMERIRADVASTSDRIWKGDA